MTTSVKISVHCASDKEVHIEVSGDPCGNNGIKVIQNGETHDLVVTDEKSVTVREVVCKTDRESWTCKNMKEYGDDMDCERYRCDVCGRTMKLYYDEMK